MPQEKESPVALVLAILVLLLWILLVHYIHSS